MNKLNLICRQIGEENDIEIIGDKRSLEILVRCLKEGQSGSFSLTSNSYTNINEQLFNRLEIKLTQGKVEINFIDNMLIISGSNEALSLLSYSFQNLYAPITQSKYSSKHNHIEYFPEHPFLTSTSKPLTVYFTE